MWSDRANLPKPSETIRGSDATIRSCQPMSQRVTPDSNLAKNNGHLQGDTSASYAADDASVHGLAARRFQVGSILASARGPVT